MTNHQNASLHAPAMRISQAINTTINEETVYAIKVIRGLINIYLVDARTNPQALSIHDIITTTISEYLDARTFTRDEDAFITQEIHAHLGWPKHLT